MRDIQKIGIIGSGLMGRQIAMNTALHGYTVLINDNSADALHAAGVWVANYLKDRVEKAKLTIQQAEAVKKRLITTENLQDFSDCDLAIEAVVEDRAVKEKLFQKLNELVPKDAFLVTNSSFMVSSIFARFIDDPGRLANLHYFNPALVMRLVEVVQGPHTRKETVDALMGFARKTGKEPIWVRKEIDGFIANRFVRAVKNEGIYLLEEGVATAQEIDTAVEKGLNYPMGPFRLMDLTGVDLSYLASKRVLDETGVKQPGHDKLKEMYEAGRWGKKSGRGWYDYTEKNKLESE